METAVLRKTTGILMTGGIGVLKRTSRGHGQMNKQHGLGKEAMRPQSKDGHEMN
jgi:hypothetical protein